MWYEIIPGIAVIYVSLTFGLFVAPRVFAPMFTAGGQAFQKELNHNPQVHAYLRDQRLTGDAYLAQGLESVSDEEPASK